CGTVLSPFLRDCRTCGTAGPSPNVRASRRADEVAALNLRVVAAKQMAANTGSLDQLNEFGAAVAKSTVVMTRKLGPLDKFVSNDNLALTTFYQQFRSGERAPEDNIWDRTRLAADGTINPLYHEDLHFAALSLDNLGVQYYGPFHVTLKEEAIEKRTTVFEENPILFLKKHAVIAGELPPLGYRAVWHSRTLLAQAKLQSRITSATKTANFPGILVYQGSGYDADFIEAHIYGPLHRNAVAKVVVTATPRGPERHIWRNVKRELQGLGVEAIISGHLGRLAIPSGTGHLLYDIGDELGRQVETAQLAYAFQDGNDTEIVEVRSLREAEAITQSAHDADVAIRLFILLLDSKDDDSERRELAIDLNQLLDRAPIRLRLDNIFFSHPYLPEFNVRRAAQAAIGLEQVEAMLANLLDHQSAIELVRKAFDAIPLPFFTSLNGLVLARELAIAKGSFALLSRG
ncbi:hypothetical protein Q9L58_010728, partial [Maublancomyces gigas]